MVAPLPSGCDSRQSRVGAQATTSARAAASAARRVGATPCCFSRCRMRRLSRPGSPTMAHERRRVDARARRADGPRRRARARPVARPGRPVVHPDAGRPRRRRHQGRAPGARRPARRRRHPRLGPALPQGQRRRGDRGSGVLPRHQSQQALADHRHRHRPRARSWCALSPNAATCLSRTSRSATWRATASTPRRCSRATRAWSTARSPVSARPGRIASAPATTTRSRAWAA